MGANPTHDLDASPLAGRRRSTATPAPLPTRERQRRDTRNLIFEAAVAEISEAGLTGARIEQIARRAGVTRPTFYAHFPTKEDVLRELQARTERSTLAALRARLGDGPEGGGVHDFVDAVFDLNEGADPVIRREAFALMLREPEHARWPDNELFGFVRERVEEAQRRGEIGRAIDADELTAVLMSALFGFLAIDGAPFGERRARAHEMIRLVVAGASAGER